MPEVTAAFWVAKGLSTAMGEATSDYLVHAINPVLAVVGGFCCFVAVLLFQFTLKRYVHWAYWSAVVAVGVFGTMAADVLHVVIGVPYVASTLLYAVALGVVFWSWQATERTLSVHSIDTSRREAFYWAAVVATFAMGTALGDLTAFTLGMGFFPSAALFSGLILVPAAGYRWLGWPATPSFWSAYVLTRPLGASIADGLGKPKQLGGLGFGDGRVAVVLGLLIVGVVVYMAAKGSGSDAAASLPKSGAVTDLQAGGEAPLGA